MPTKLVRILWSEKVTSLVRLSTDERGYAVVKITGAEYRLRTLHDYRNADAAYLELSYIARKEGARLTVEKGGGR